MNAMPWSRRRVLAAVAALGTLSRASALTPSVQATITLSTAEAVDQCLNLLADFSTAEHLLISSDKQMNETRVVKRRTLVLDDGTRFVASNFSSPMTLEMHVITQDDATAWRPLWSRLIERIKAQFGTDSVLVTDRD